MRFVILVVALTFLSACTFTSERSLALPNESVDGGDDLRRALDIEVVVKGARVGGAEVFEMSTLDGVPVSVSKGDATFVLTGFETGSTAERTKRLIDPFFTGVKIQIFPMTKAGDLVEADLIVTISGNRGDGISGQSWTETSRSALETRLGKSTTLSFAQSDTRVTVTISEKTTSLNERK